MKEKQKDRIAEGKVEAIIRLGRDKQRSQTFSKTTNQEIDLLHMKLFVCAKTRLLVARGQIETTYCNLADSLEPIS